MKLIILVVLGLAALANSKTINSNENFELATLDSSLLADNSDASLTVPELIEKYGYPVEVHHITTEDGYILQAHRIPYGKKCGRAEGKRVVWLQHGLFGDSSNWITSGPEKGLAYNLADECYDVWMGNYRGNTYSRRHVDLNPDKNKKHFWTYSWNEVGIYDLPADFDYVLNYTKTDGIFYIGHSMGTTGFFVCMSERPEYNSKIKLMSAYAPVAYTQHMKSPIALIAPFDGQIQWFMNMFGIYEFLPSNAFMEFLGRTLCHQNSPIKAVCSNILFLLCGYNVDQFDHDILPTILGHSPAGASSRMVVHYSQGVKSSKFRKYNHGLLKNLREYGQLSPPEYDLSKITAPVAFYWGQNDWLADTKDVARLADQLPNLKLNYRVPHNRYNHLDFLWAKDNLDLLHNKTIEFMKNF